MAGRVIHTGQAIVDLVMRVEALPPRGGDIFAREWDLRPGGGFNVMAAASRDGAHVVYTGGHGTGPFGEQVRAAMRSEGVEVLAPTITGQDTGFCVALVEDDTERTFVSTVGAEGVADPDVIGSVAVTPADVVYTSGYSLYHKSTRTVLEHWLAGLAADVDVVFDASPVVAELSADALSVACRYATVWTVNEREARSLTARLTGVDGDDPENLATRLRGALDRAVVVRTGASGCWVAADDSPAVHVPGLDVDAVDTNGAGDAHTGVLCADRCRGEPLVDAAYRGNVAAAIATTRHGPATAPMRAETDRLTTR